MRSILLALVFVPLSLSTSLADDPAPAPKPITNVVPVPRPKAPTWGEVKCEPGVPLPLTVEGAKSVRWILVDETLATLTTVPDSQAAVFNAPLPARIRVIAIADGEPHLTMMVAGTPPPGPGPTPPTPPVPPKPVDELTKQLAAAYAADPGPTRAADLRQLVALYMECEKAAHDARFRTAGSLFAAVSETAAELLPDDPTTGRRLAGVRKLIAAELAKVLPTDPDAVLVEADRVTAAAAFARFARALQQVAP